MAEQRPAPRRPVLLIILDGFGINPARLHNGIALAETPRLDEYFSHNPMTLLQASGKAVGLPDGQMGNSEVGHLTIGCGDIVRQDLVAIDDAINDSSFFDNAVFKNCMERAKAGSGYVHLFGLVSDGGVHSHIRHLFALIDLCRRYGLKPLLHMVTDGRDTAPRSALTYLGKLTQALDDADGKFVSISGRYYAMDRDNRWERIEKAWRVIALGKGPQMGSVEEAIKASYLEELSDEFIRPVLLSPGHALQADDQMIFFNFRKDRARQMTAALNKADFDAFERPGYSPIDVVCMTQYDEWFRLDYAFEQDKPKTTLSEVVSRANLRQFHCAETEKYAHVTYFLNGRHGDAYEGEDRIIVPSPKVATYDLAPAMSAKQVADEVIDALQSNRYAFLAVNFANGDMVGHTGIAEAIIQAVQTLDAEVGRVLDCAKCHGYSVLLTADHGNCEQMVDPITGEPHTQHTAFPVPCMIMDETPWQLSVGAGLSAIAPTILQLMGLTQPQEIRASSLLLKPLN